MDDAEVLDWIRQQASSACSIFSVCTGALICGAADGAERANGGASPPNSASPFQPQAENDRGRSSFGEN